MEKKNINAEQSKKQEDNGGKMMQEDNSTSSPNQISNPNPPLCPSFFHGSLNNNQFDNTIRSNIVTVDPYNNPAHWCYYTYPRDLNFRTPFRDCTGTGYFLPTSSRMTQNPVRQSGSQTNNNNQSLAFRPLIIRPSTSQQGSGSDGIKRSVNIECNQVSSRRSLSTAQSSVCHDDIPSFPDNTEPNKLDEKPLDVGQSCKICNEDILGQETRVFPCQHAFHIKCLQFLTHPQAHLIQPHCPHCPFCIEFPIRQSGSQTNNNNQSLACRPLMIRPSTSQQGSDSDGIKRSVNIECSQVSSRRSLSTAQSSVCQDDIHSFPDNTEPNKLDEKPLDVGQSCKMCNEDLLGQETRVFPCQHAFHIKCLQFLTHPQAHLIQPHCPHCPFCLEFPIRQSGSQTNNNNQSFVCRPLMIRPSTSQQGSDSDGIKRSVNMEWCQVSSRRSSTAQSSECHDDIHSVPDNAEPNKLDEKPLDVGQSFKICNEDLLVQETRVLPFHERTGTRYFPPTSSRMTQNPVRQSQTNNNKQSIACRRLMIRPSTSQQGSGSDGIKRSVKMEWHQVSSRRSLSTAQSSVCQDDIHSFPDNTEINKLDEKPLDVGQSCKMCNEDLLGQETRVFPCQHAFHIKCLQFLTHPQAHLIQPHCPHCPFCIEFPIKMDLS